MMIITRPATATACALVLGFSGVGAATAATGPNLTCGEVITASVTLTGNLRCHGTALIVDADDKVTLDLGGHTVTGDGTGDGVVLASSDVPYFTYTVQNGRISDFASGVRAGYIDAARVSGVTITASPTAVELDQQLVDLFFAHSRITGATNDFAYDLFETQYLVSFDVTDSAIIGGAEQAITFLGNSYYNNDHITDSPVSFQTPGNDVITHNVFNNSPITEGTFGGGLQINDNTIENAPTGLVDYSLGGDTISGNTFKDNGGDGAFLYIGSGSGGNGGNETITNNRFLDNGASGLYFNLASGGGVGTISSNAATGNGFLANGATDFEGHPLADGITVDQNGGVATLGENRTTGNAAFGLWLDQSSTVANAGGNISHHDPQGCAPFNLCNY